MGRSKRGHQQGCVKSAFTRLTYRNAAQHSLLSYGLDAGYCAGVAYALLAITTALLPIGETRDWIQYFLIAGWAAVYVAGRFVSQGSACVHYLKLAFSAYAAIMLSQMLILTSWPKNRRGWKPFFPARAAIRNTSWILPPMP